MLHQCCTSAARLLARNTSVCTHIRLLDPPRPFPFVHRLYYTFRVAMKQ